MKDFLGKELQIGDSVVMMVPNYRSLVKGVIIAFTPKMVRVAYANTWNYGKIPHMMDRCQEPTQLVKI